MGQVSPPPPAPDRAQFDRAMRLFLVEMAERMDLPAGAAEALANRSPIRGSSGFLCRLEIARHTRAAIRPEILLPISMRDLEGRDIRHLLVLHEALAAELRWRVGLSTDGILQLMAMDWIEDPRDAVFALDLGQLLGRDALRELQGKVGGSSG